MAELHTYRERQYFRQPIIFLVLLLLLALFVWAFIEQIILDRPFGTNPAPNAVLIAFSMIPTLFLLLFIFMKQQTIINANMITIVIAPFGKRQIRWENVRKAYIRSYQPLLEYGGWGIRYGFRKNGMAYSVGGGNQGLQLELKDGQKVLIGTKNAQQLEQFLKTEGLLTEKNSDS